MVKYIIFAGFGRLLVYFAQQFPKPAWWGKFLTDLFSCDLCLGVWAYTILAVIFRVDILQGTFPYIPGLSELITGTFVSLIMHLIRVGWEDKFRIYYIE